MQQSESNRTGPNPAMLRWAREDAGLSLDEAARRLHLRRSKLGTPGERLAQYERGGQPVPNNVIHRMCDIYRQPFINFFTSEPPLPDDYGHDFRTFPAPTTPEEEGALRAIQGDMFVRQGVVRDCLGESDDHSPLQFVGSLAQRDGIDSAVNQLHRLLETDRHGDPCRQVRSPRQLFRELRSRIERLGVFVLIANDAKDRYLKLRCTAFSGIAIADTLAPFVVINGDDPAQPLAFELVHQFVHLLVGTTGVCNAPHTNGATSGACKIETFCRGVAAEFLVPGKLVTHTVRESASSKITASQVTKWVDALVRERHVSRTTAGYQLLRRKLIRESDLVRATDPPSKERAKVSKKTRGQPPSNRPSSTKSTAEQRQANRFATQKERLGEPLISLIRALVGEQEITYNSAGLALGTTAGLAASLLHDS